MIKSSENVFLLCDMYSPTCDEENQEPGKKLTEMARTEMISVEAADIGRASTAPAAVKIPLNAPAKSAPICRLTLPFRETNLIR